VMRAMRELPPKYSPKDVEEKWYKVWEEGGYFRPERGKSEKVFSMVIPPPNITGSLHMGHAVNSTIQDIIVRWHRMRGFKTLWVPGVDHAGIATQNVVERELAKEGKSRHDLGREEFVKRVWQWKEEYGNTIMHQLRKLGASCDWSRQRFTMDEGCSRAVREEFVRLYQEGLIYRANYIINWCPRCHTALSDIEVEHKEHNGPEENGEGFITVATTRPETMLGDTAVAVHPDDERYKHLIGKNLILPLVGRKLPVIGDTRVDPEFGTGAVKVTPAHDPLDFEIGKTHNLEEVQVIAEDGSMINVPEKYAGLDRYACREAVLEDLEKEGLLEKIEDYTHSVGHCYRCDAVIEPLISLQWFVKMKPLAEPGIKVVEEGKVQFIPPRWKKTYIDWMENIRDWCISRQIWWGHRIPVWYCKDCGQESVSRHDLSQCPKCGSQNIEQDPDVLDTWFSSALWPFSTLGWPDKTQDLETYYPTSFLVTGYEIIYFWVARMIMMGLKFMGDIPFHNVYIHGIVRDAKGRKMSKSLGNVIDPLDIIKEYGADALRLALAQITTLGGQDIFLAMEKIQAARNFTNKIWNAFRFIYMNSSDGKWQEWLREGQHPDLNQLPIEARWILTRTNELIQQVNQALEECKFSEASYALYEFTWHEFCDWYVEFSKIPLSSGDEEARDLTLWTLYWVMDKILRLLHPFMPFITEEIWQYMPHRRDCIIVEDWPEVCPELMDSQASALVRKVCDVVVAARNIRSEWSVPPSVKAAFIIKPANSQETDALRQMERQVASLIGALRLVVDEEAKIDGIALSNVTASGSVVYMLPEGVVDLDAERERLMRQLEKVEQEIERVSRKLANENFVKKAPPEIVRKEEEKFEELKRRREQLLDNLEMIKA